MYLHITRLAFYSLSYTRKLLFKVKVNVTKNLNVGQARERAGALFGITERAVLVNVIF